MQRFIPQENIANFRRLLDEPTGDVPADTLRLLLLAAQRDLAFLESSALGVGNPLLTLGKREDQFNADPSVVSRFQAACGNAPKLSLAVDPGPGLHILDANDAYLEATMTMRENLCGRPLFQIFPDNPDDPAADGVSSLYSSLRMASETGKPHAMPIQRYDIRDFDGRFVERYWSPLNTPIFDDDGNMIYLLHQVEDVTQQVQSDPNRLSRD